MASRAAGPRESACELSIVIPAYNEAQRLPRTLAAWAAALPELCNDAEIIVSDDGSCDETAEIARTAASGAPPSCQVRLVQAVTNRGKGHATRCGVNAAVGGEILLTDADLPCVPSELPRFRAALAAGADIVIGSRDLPDSVLDPPQPWSRRLLAGAFRWVRQRVLLPTLRDTQCGFKLLRADAARAVFAEAREDGWLFDVELLAIADALGLKIVELPVRWSNDRDSRVRPLRVLPTVLPTLLRIRRRVRRLQPTRS